MSPLTEYGYEMNKRLLEGYVTGVEAERQRLREAIAKLEWHHSRLNGHDWLWRDAVLALLDEGKEE